MTELVREEGAPRVSGGGEATAPDTSAPEGQHWAGYAGEPEAEAYPVVDRGRYKLLLVLTLLAFLGTATALATRESETLPPQDEPFAPR